VAEMLVEEVGLGCEVRVQVGERAEGLAHWWERRRGRRRRVRGGGARERREREPLHLDGLVGCGWLSAGWWRRVAKEGGHGRRGRVLRRRGRGERRGATSERGERRGGSGGPEGALALLGEGLGVAALGRSVRVLARLREGRARCSSSRRSCAGAGTGPAPGRNLRLSLSPRTTTGSPAHLRDLLTYSSSLCCAPRLRPAPRPHPAPTTSSSTLPLALKRRLTSHTPRASVQQLATHPAPRYRLAARPAHGYGPSFPSTFSSLALPHASPSRASSVACGALGCISNFSAVSS